MRKSFEDVVREQIIRVCANAAMNGGAPSEGVMRRAVAAILTAATGRDAAEPAALARQVQAAWDGRFPPARDIDGRPLDYQMAETAVRAVLGMSDG